MTSLTGVGSSAQQGGVAFITTNWSVVLEAQGQSPAAQQALEKLCRTYWRPVYSFIRREGTGPEEAEDLTQGFFALLLERRNFEVFTYDLWHSDGLEFRAWRYVPGDI